MQNKLSTKKGFTLIEIVIALAIAALIIVVVLIAVGGAQRSQRNDARRAVADRVRAAINDARANLGVDGGDPTQAQVENATSSRKGAENTDYDVLTTGFPSDLTAACTPVKDDHVYIAFSPDRAVVCLEGTNGLGSATGAWYLSK